MKPIIHLIAQGFRFGLVGIVATLVHISVFIFCIEILEIEPIWANFPAFGIAFIVGFSGHYHWTFKQNQHNGELLWWVNMLKFAVVSVFGLGLNSAIVYIIVNRLHLPYGYAVMLMATVVPLTAFVLSKHWAFTS